MFCEECVPIPSVSVISVSISCLFPLFERSVHMYVYVIYEECAIFSSSVHLGILRGVCIVILCEFACTLEECVCD